MNMYTQSIAKVAGVNLDEALQIQNFIDESAMIDWSEASNRKIASTVKLAVQVMAVGGWENF
jgi:hypothetical protein